MIAAFIAITLISCILLPFSSRRLKAWISLATIAANLVISTILIWNCFSGDSLEIIYKGSLISGSIALRADALSAWFIAIINFIFLCGGIYGAFYMKAYASEKQNSSMHFIAFVLLHASLLALCVIQNSLVFLAVWEIMALTAFICVIFEHQKVNTLKAGINYLIQSHVAIVFLMLGFILAAIKTGSYDFQSISIFSQQQPGSISMAIFCCFFIGFAIKAGFIPFHTWLPHAHPAAPSHISGIMSGVIIKIGIYGILRMLLIIKLNYITIAYIILAFSIFSSLYGVMLAIIQHNLKKLLAYHSIENIGIIGIGIGIGCLGLGYDNHTLAFVGFAGGLLHVWNHALFKSLLFFTTGNVYQAYHTVDIEKLGGISKKMPQTSLLFLVAALAICGLPPFNGFISEFLIYSGLYNWLQQTNPSNLIVVIFSITALVFIGGLAMLCFTKAFGIVFLGNNRHEAENNIKEVSIQRLLPLYAIASGIVFIGLFPNLLIHLLYFPVRLFSKQIVAEHQAIPQNLIDTLQYINVAVLAFLGFTVLVYGLKRMIAKQQPVAVNTTWGCGFSTNSPKLQYTASSFVRSYSKLFRFIVLIFQKEKDIQGVFPENVYYETHPYDRIEKNGIDAPISAFKSFLTRFLFLQNGRLQVYILYGIFFIVLTIAVPAIYQNFHVIIEFFKQL